MRRESGEEKEWRESDGCYLQGQYVQIALPRSSDLVGGTALRSWREAWRHMARFR